MSYRRLGSRLAVVVSMVLGAVACSALEGALPGLSAESTCAEFLAADQQQRAAVADELYRARHGAPNSMGAMGALFNLEAVCASNPDRQLGDVSV